MYFRHFNGFFCFVVSLQNNVTRGLDYGMCRIFSEKQACVASRQPLELLEHMLSCD